MSLFGALVAVYSRCELVKIPTQLRQLVHVRINIVLTHTRTNLLSPIQRVHSVSAIVTFALVADGTVDAPTLFTVIATFGKLRMPLMMIPQSVAGIADARVGAKRVGAFLALEEIEQKPRENDEKTDNYKSGNIAIRITQGEFFWVNPKARVQDDLVVVSGKTKQKKNNRERSDSVVGPVVVESWTSANPTYEVMPVLQDVECSMHRETLTAVVGAVGSGKSSLCNAILGEMFRTKGAVEVNGSVAYASQSPWILHATIRDNILFGEAFDEKRYQRVLEVCQLTHDLEILEAGDQVRILVLCNVTRFILFAVAAWVLLMHFFLCYNPLSKTTSEPKQLPINTPYLC
jgi:ATP-binding cassette subfamily C (CFTR/MRP) protein 1